MPSAPLLRVENLRQAQRAASPENSSRQVLFSGLSFELAAGEHVAVLGARASGKTALLRSIALIQKPEAGHIYFEGKDLAHAWDWQLRAVRQRLQFVGGDPVRTLPPRYSVEQTLAEPLRIHRRGPAAEQPARIQAAAVELGLNPLLLSRAVSALSPAMRQRVALARALTLHPSLLICDELTERLEPAAAQPLLERLARICRAGKIAWLWTTSDPRLAHAFADRVLRLENGQLSN
ncbi:MAG: ATP-binding cassette domain-containing protein [Anaerolineales bacterium]